MPAAPEKKKPYCPQKAQKIREKKRLSEATEKLQGRRKEGKEVSFLGK